MRVFVRVAPNTAVSSIKTRETFCFPPENCPRTVLFSRTKQHMVIEQMKTRRANGRNDGGRKRDSPSGYSIAFVASRAFQREKEGESKAQKKKRTKKGKKKEKYAKGEGGCCCFPAISMKIEHLESWQPLQLASSYSTTRPAFYSWRASLNPDAKISKKRNQRRVNGIVDVGK